MVITGALIDRLERSAAALTADVAEAMVAGGAAGASSAEPWCGGQLVALGPGRYVNRLVGVGTAEVDVAQAATVEEFFRARGVDPMIEVSSWASPSLLQLLAEHGYVPTSFRNVHAAALGSAVPAPPARVRIERVDESLLDTWLDVLAAGNDISDASGRATSDEYARARFAMPAGENFLAYVDDRPAGYASMETADGIAWLGGATTVRAFRDRGVHRALIRHRLALATAHGSDLAASTAAPHGPSARNLAAHGLAIVCTQVACVQRR